MKIKYPPRSQGISPLWLLSWFFLAGIMSPLRSQVIEFIEGSHQSWSGGICCRHGSNYILYFKLSPGNDTIHLDTIWTGGYCKPLKLAFNPSEFKKDSIITVYQSIVMDDRHHINFEDHIDICHDASMRGIFLVYRKKGKRFLLHVTDKITQLFPLAYP